MNAIVSDFRTLRGMEIQGFVKLMGSPKSRERHWTGQYVRITHVHPGPKLDNWWEVFKHRGTEYRIEYFDGCFHPFVVRTAYQSSKPKFV